MTKQTKVSAARQVLIPKEICEQLDWRPGAEIEIEESADGLFLRAKRPRREPMSWEEFRQRMPRYDGPPVSIEEMDEAIERERVRRWAEKERNSR
jgi:AbrB family looped-hinge helix DNA binding protein